MQLKEKNGIKFLESEIINTTHIFTTRIGGVSTEKEYASLNLGVRTQDDAENVAENYTRLSKTFNLSKIITPKQEHTDNVVVLDKNSDLNALYIADGFVTAQKGITIGVFTADCVPVLLYDDDKKVIAAVHSGWRGTTKKISVKAVKIMKEEFNCKNIKAAIGPSIGKCCFEIGEDTKQVFDVTHPHLAYLTKEYGNKFKSHVAGFIEEDLKEAGVTQIDRSDLCTYCSNDLFFSHRSTDKGRQGAFIKL